MTHRFLILFLFWIGSLQVIAQSDKVLPADRIIKLIPAKIEDFRLDGDSQSKLIKLGTLRYSMAEKNFAAGRNRSIKILLFDYKEAPIMYTQATRRLGADTVPGKETEIRRSITFVDCIGWESYDAEKKNSQILIGIFNRFYLTIEGKNVDLESLRKVVQAFKFETFPK